MDLTHVGESFSQAHPIMNILGGWLGFFIWVLILIVWKFVFPKIKSYIRVFLMLLFVLFTGLLVVSASMKVSYSPNNVYEGKAEVKSISPVDNSMKQTIVLKNKEGKRQLKLPKDKLKGIKKDDKVKMLHEKYIDLPDAFGSIYIDPKTKKLNKHINFEEIPNLEHNIEMKKIK